MWNTSKLFLLNTAYSNHTPVRDFQDDVNGISHFLNQISHFLPGLSAEWLVSAEAQAGSPSQSATLALLTPHEYFRTRTRGSYQTDTTASAQPPLKHFPPKWAEKESVNPGLPGFIWEKVSHLTQAAAAWTPFNTFRGCLLNGLYAEVGFSVWGTKSTHVYGWIM